MKALNVFILLFILGEVHSQPTKNSFSLYYVPQITKTDFEKILMNNPLFFKEFYETIKPDKPLGGYSFGAAYNRKLKKSSLGIYFKKNVRGQKSGYAYNYRGLIPADTSSTFGGLYYFFKMESVSLGATFERQIIQNPKFYSAIQFGFGLDVYQTAYLKNFNIDVRTGSLRRGCCFVEYSHHTGSGFKNFIEHFREGIYRAELSLSFRNLLQLFKNTDIEISPQIFFLSKILRESKALDHTIPDGRIIAGGVKFGLNYRF